jgi:Ca-activated chloride channel family protein
MIPTLRLEHAAPSPGKPLTVRALLSLAGDPPADRGRVPLNLALVLDRSGSMGGPKLQAAREAASLAVGRLWPDDLVGVVAYDDEVVVVEEPGPGTNQTGLAQRLRGIEPGGMTNLSGGWLKGRELVARNAGSEGVHRVLLLTDGRANHGITDPEVLTELCRTAAAHGITTTTIGFGRDFDEELLRSMADAGGGATYYIEKSDQAPAVFEEELDGLLSLTAQNVAVEVRTTSAVGLAAVRHSYPSTPTGDGLRLELGDLYAREPKRLLLELAVDEVPGAGAGGSPGDAAATHLATLSLTADVLEAGGGVVHRTLDLAITLDVEEGARVDPEVRREMLLLDAADARERALEEERRGRWDAAAEALRRASRKLRTAGLDDERVQEEAEDLERMSVRAEAREMDEADRKYLYQRAYDSGRGRGSSHRTISRKEKR